GRCRVGFPGRWRAVADERGRCRGGGGPGAGRRSSRVVAARAPASARFRLSDVRASSVGFWGLVFSGAAPLPVGDRLFGVDRSEGERRALDGAEDRKSTR